MNALLNKIIMKMLNCFFDNHGDPFTFGNSNSVIAIGIEMLTTESILIIITFRKISAVNAPYVIDRATTARKLIHDTYQLPFVSRHNSDKIPFLGIW